LNGVLYSLLMWIRNKTFITKSSIYFDRILSQTVVVVFCLLNKILMNPVMSSACICSILVLKYINTLIQYVCVLCIKRFGRSGLLGYSLATTTSVFAVVKGSRRTRTLQMVAMATQLRYETVHKPVRGAAVAPRTKICSRRSRVRALVSIWTTLKI